MDCLKSSEKSGVLSLDEALVELAECKAICIFQIQRFVQSPEDIEDVWQQISLNVSQKYHTVENRLSFKKWVKTIAHNVAVNFAMRRKGVYVNEELPLEFATGREVDPAEQTIANEQIRIMHQFIQTLNETYCDVVQLFYFQGKSLAEISMELNLPLGTVKRRLYTFRENLRTQMQPYFDA